MNSPAKFTLCTAWRATAALVLSAMLALSACTSKNTTHKFNARDISGVMPSLEFTLINQEGAVATAADFKHKTTLLYFGFTNCADVCPVTLANLVQTLKLLGPAADSVRVLFVSVDPARDTPQVLKKYTAAFAPLLAPPPLDAAFAEAPSTAPALFAPGTSNNASTCLGSTRVIR